MRTSLRESRAANDGGHSPDSETYSDADVARYARAYAAPEHLRAALEIYRAFPANEKFNAAQHQARSAIMDLELDICSASPNLHHKDSRREPDETRDS